MSQSPTERFSGRVEKYLKYRPHYPKEIVAVLKERTGLRKAHEIADIGSGTGFSAELFLDNGNFVYGVEPNAPMREAGEGYLRTYKNFRSIAATAEQTTLAASSVDYIIAGQAFHWFKPEETRKEFRRILRNPGWCVLIWNDRQTGTTPFLREYEALLQEFGTDYNEINHRNIDLNKITEFFERTPEIVEEMPYVQRVDYDGLEGRLLSSSYVPNVGEPRYEEMLVALKLLFEKHAVNGRMDLLYTTLVYGSRLI